MPFAEIYRWVVFILLVLGLVLMKKQKNLDSHVVWSRIQYYTVTTFALYFIWLGLTDFQVHIPFLYTADCRFVVCASMMTLFLLYHLVLQTGLIKTQKLNDMKNYEHYNNYNYVFHTVIPVSYFLDYFLLVDRSGLHWQIIFAWLLYPILYLVFVYVRAWITRTFHINAHLYPYNFLDPTQSSMSQIVKFVVIMGVTFFVMGLGVYALGWVLDYFGIPPLSWTWNGPFGN